MGSVLVPSVTPDFKEPAIGAERRMGGPGMLLRGTEETGRLLLRRLANSSCAQPWQRRRRVWALERKREGEEQKSGGGVPAQGSRGLYRGGRGGRPGCRGARRPCRQWRGRALTRRAGERVGAGEGGAARLGVREVRRTR